MTRDEIILNLFNDENYSKSDILEYVKAKSKDLKLKPKTLGLLFEAYIDVIGWEDETNKISPFVKIDDLLKINIGFKSENGCQWARSDNSSYLGKKYKIIRNLKNGSVYEIKLNGLNTNPKYRYIHKDIVKMISRQNCSILDIGTRIEVDHKNGRYNDKNLIDPTKQKITDFQPLCKTANDAKRHHCYVCIRSKKRYDAKRLGYSCGWIEGNINNLNCIGCYWYDPKKFNKIISKNFEQKTTAKSYKKSK